MGSETRNGSHAVKPGLTLLNQEQKGLVHEQSLHILSSVGVRVDCASARSLFARAIGPAVGPAMGPTGLNDDIVRIPAELVERALNAAPSTVEVFDRSGRSTFGLPGASRFGMGVTTLYYQDPETDAVSPFSRKNMETVVRLGNSLPSFDVISTIGIVQDVPPDLSDLYATLEMTANTTKPLVVLISQEELFPAVLDLLEHLHGDLASKPFVIPYFNPISPLVINKGTSDKMAVAIERGLPFIYSNYGMAGASTPITPAGTLVLLNAELLAGLTLSQLMQEGSPVILGSLPAFFDMKGSGSFYDARSYLVDLACAEMMAHYDLPHCGTSGSGMGWGPDLITAGHQWTNHLLSCLGKVGLVPFVGDTLGAMAYAPAIAVFAHDIIEQARILAQGFALDADAVGLEEIAEAGPGGNYLTSGQTLRLFRSAYHRSEYLPHLGLEEWQARGCPRSEEALRRHTLALLAEPRVPDDYGDIMQRGEAFIREAGVC